MVSHVNETHNKNMGSITANMISHGLDPFVPSHLSHFVILANSQYLK